MYRRGIVTELDPATHRARVRLPDRDNITSPWLNVLAPTAHDDKVFGLPPVGSQVAVLLDEHDEAGCILGAIYSTQDQPTASSEQVRRIDFRDGTRIEYDAEAQRLNIALADGASVHVTGGVVHVGESAEPVALSPLVEERFRQIEERFDVHLHPTGVGPSGQPTQPLGPLESVAAKHLKAT